MATEFRGFAPATTPAPRPNEGDWSVEELVRRLMAGEHLGRGGFAPGGGYGPAGESSVNAAARGAPFEYTPPLPGEIAPTSYEESEREYQRMVAWVRRMQAGVDFAPSPEGGMGVVPVNGISRGAVR